MTEKTKVKRPTKAELRRKVLELQAQLIHAYFSADVNLPKCGDLRASGVLVQLTALGGRELVPPFVIKDGLSLDTIEALRRDVAKSYHDCLALKPKTL